MDSTNWKFSDTNINILILGIIYDGMAFPIVFKMTNKGMKSIGFDIEGSHVRDQSYMSNLFAIIMVAYAWYHLVGIFINEYIKPITVLKHGRRAVSLFY